jgi:hypothetical protein
LLVGCGKALVQRGRACRGGGGPDWVGDRDDILHGFWWLAQGRNEPDLSLFFFAERNSGWVKCQEGDLWGTVEPEGQADGADAAVDIELHLVEAEVAFGVFHAHRG